MTTLIQDGLRGVKETQTKSSKAFSSTPRIVVFVVHELNAERAGQNARDALNKRQQAKTPKEHVS